jgi:tetratricopeptide (TPR) repeat protein
MEEAERAYRDALKLQQQLAADFPTVPAYRQDLARSHQNLVNLLHAAGRLQDAETAYLDAIRLKEQLAADFPTVPAYRQALAGIHNNLGILLAARGRHQEAEKAYHRALALGKQLAAEFPNMPDYRNELAGTMVNVALISRDRKEFLEARELLVGADPHHQAALKANPRNPTYREFFLNNRSILAPVLASLGDHTGAVRVTEQLAALGWILQQMPTTPRACWRDVSPRRKKMPSLPRPSARSWSAPTRSVHWLCFGRRSPKASKTSTLWTKTPP